MKKILLTILILFSIIILAEIIFFFILSYPQWSKNTYTEISNKAANIMQNNLKYYLTLRKNNDLSSFGYRMKFEGTVNKIEKQTKIVGKDFPNKVDWLISFKTKNNKDIGWYLNDDEISYIEIVDYLGKKYDFPSFNLKPGQKVVVEFENEIYSEKLISMKILVVD